MKSIEVSNAQRLMFLTFMIGPETHVSAEQRELFWYASNQKEMTFPQYMAIVEFVGETLIDDPSVEGGKSKYLFNHLETVLTAIALENELGLIDIMKIYASSGDERAEFLRVANQENKTASIPSNDEIQTTIVSLTKIVQNEILNKIMGKMSELGIDGDGSDIIDRVMNRLGGLPTVGDDVEINDLDSWGASGNKRRKLQ